MANRPYKTTGCFRFAIFLLIFAPLAYLGASYYNGQDGIGNLKNMVNKVVNVFSTTADKVSDKVSTTATRDDDKPTFNIAEYNELKSEVERKNKELNTLINENLDLKLKLRECENKIAPR